MTTQEPPFYGDKRRKRFAGTPPPPPPRMPTKRVIPHTTFYEDLKSFSRKVVEVIRIFTTNQK